MDSSIIFASGLVGGGILVFLTVITVGYLFTPKAKTNLDPAKDLKELKKKSCEKI